MLSLRQSLARIRKQPPLRIPSDVEMPSKCLRQTLVFWSGMGNPHQNYPYYYKGQVHVHSNATLAPECQFSPARVEGFYRDKGYHFICLTDHNGVTPDPDVDHILHITSAEDGWAGKHHLLVLGIIDPSHGLPDAATGDPSSIQYRIDYINRHGALAVPNIHDYAAGGVTWEEAELLDSHGYTGLEIYNANGGDACSDGYVWWDDILCSGKRVWGFATDDFENQANLDSGTFNRGWLVVNSRLGPPEDLLDQQEEELRKDILANIKAGNFYAVVRGPTDPPHLGMAELGPRLVIQIVNGNTLRLETDQLCTYIAFLGWQKEVLRESYDVSVAEYEITGAEYYVRVVVDQIRYEQLHRACSQPIFLPYTGTLQGLVTDWHAHPAQDVHLRFVQDLLVFSTRTDETGHYKIGLPGGYWLIEARSDDPNSDVYNGATNVGHAVQPWDIQLPKKPILP
jgi:hypothetical protein